jgi:hypothetical protein
MQGTLNRVMEGSKGTDRSPGNSAGVKSNVSHAKFSLSTLPLSHPSHSFFSLILPLIPLFHPSPLSSFSRISLFHPSPTLIILSDSFLSSLSLSHHSL